MFSQRTTQIGTNCKIGGFWGFFFKLVHNRVVSSVKAFQMVLKYIFKCKTEEAIFGKLYFCCCSYKTFLFFIG